jgi:glycosyltransferase involved in cell wall biosynthesis
MVNPTVSVLMPVRDTPAAMLDQAIDSILAQSFRDYEFLILDDGSRDAQTRRCLERRAGQDSRIRLECGLARGLPATLNAGLARARGELIVRQDSDDWSETRRIERQVAFLRVHDEIALCGTAAWMHQQDGTPLWRTRAVAMPAAIRAALERGNPFVHGSTVYRRETALGIGGYREGSPCAQDYDFCWRLAEAGDGANLEEPLYHYRFSAGSISVRRAVEQGRAHRAAQMLARARRRGEPEDALAAFEAAIDSGEQGAEAFRARLKQADHMMLAGEYRRALREYSGALRSHPASALAWAKLARCGVFVSLPVAREACFR